MPNPLLTLSYTLHMLATVVLVGGLFVLSVLWLPAAGRALSPVDQAALLRATLRRFQPLAWLSIAVLMATGLTQMAASPAYVGLLVLENRWSVAMFAKHLAFGAMVALAVYQTWVLAPALERQILSRAARGEAEDAASIAPQRRMLRLNFWIGLIILLLTAVARTA